MIDNTIPVAAPKYILSLFALALFVAGCQERREHTAPAVNPRDSVSMMVSYGVNTLVSDSGMMKYRIVAECWEVNQVRTPSRWIFEKGLFLEQFDEKFHVQAYIQCDTAYYYDEKRVWELRNRVTVHNKNGIIYTGSQLFWDEGKHEFYSYAPSRVVTPERTLEGRYFRSDERMTRYYVSESSGSFVKGDISDEENDTTIALPDTAKAKLRPQALPQRKLPAAPR